MSGSDRFVGLLASLHTLLANYPIEADMSSVEVEIDAFGREAATVHLWPTRLAILAAGLVEWERTLASGTASMWRTPDGHSVHLTLNGRSDEGDIPVQVWGSVPFHEHVFGDLAPGDRRRIDTALLALWALGGGQVTP
jgi:hypothetical protein